MFFNTVKYKFAQVKPIYNLPKNDPNSQLVSYVILEKDEEQYNLLLEQARHDGKLVANIFYSPLKIIFKNNLVILKGDGVLSKCKNIDTATNQAIEQSFSDIGNQYISGFPVRTIGKRR